jgi:acetyl-CoA carboxylase biotin carboxylase subunit
MAYVREADAAYCIGPPPARDSYLNVDALLDAVRRSGCDAVHPGWGFLSENAAFARAVEESGVRFIGPRATDITDMGDKVVARRKMAAAGVPVLPASGPLSELPDLTALGSEIGYPMLVKAAAGGGGIGMQRVLGAETLVAAIEKTRQLSDRAFGDATVYLERLLEAPRHVEFQMVGDGSGRVQHLFERDCSIQRRHQKVIEEAPAPGIDHSAAAAMAEQLATVLGGWDYHSLGTVEMLMDRDGRFYFLEMNTRLQVEHGVTEAVTGLDLVRMQLQIAGGATLEQACPSAVTRSGHAIELRIYAEDPRRFFPSAGRLTAFSMPQGSGIHVETHLSEGDLITPHYDPMLALLVVHGCDRADAIHRALAALEDVVIEGPKSNVPFLRHVLATEEFIECQHHTTSAEQLSQSVA